MKAIFAYGMFPSDFDDGDSMDTNPKWYAGRKRNTISRVIVALVGDPRQPFSFLDCPASSILLKDMHGK